MGRGARKAGSAALARAGQLDSLTTRTEGRWGALVSVPPPPAHGALASLGGRAPAQGDLEAYRSLAREGATSAVDNDTISGCAPAPTRSARERLCLAQVTRCAPPREHGPERHRRPTPLAKQSLAAPPVPPRKRWPSPNATSPLPRQNGRSTRSRSQPPPTPKGKLNLNTPLKGTMIYLRRSDDQGNVPLLAHTSLSLNTGVIAWCAARWTHPSAHPLYAMRRRDPHYQPCSRGTLPSSNKSFQGKP